MKDKFYFLRTLFYTVLMLSIGFFMGVVFVMHELEEQGIDLNP